MGTPKLLLVDDERNLLDACRRALRGEENWEIIVSETPQKALEEIAYEDFTVVISDQRMPGMTGVEFLRKAKGFCPKTVRIILTGYPDEDGQIEAALKDGTIYKCLLKPWDTEEFRQTLKSAIALHDQAK
ncbi:MAG: response regulator [Deltaproteobacteria bacterium]|nr:MAG: response regulator [Deltaproteobacteria bacterium]